MSGTDAIDPVQGSMMYFTSNSTTPLATMDRDQQGVVINCGDENNYVRVYGNRADGSVDVEVLDKDNSNSVTKFHVAAEDVSHLMIRGCGGDDEFFMGGARGVLTGVTVVGDAGKDEYWGPENTHAGVDNDDDALDVHGNITTFDAVGERVAQNNGTDGGDGGGGEIDPLQQLQNGADVNMAASGDGGGSESSES